MISKGFTCKTLCGKNSYEKEELMQSNRSTYRGSPKTGYYGHSQKQVFHLGSLEIDSAKGSVFFRGSPVLLDEKEYGIILLFATHPGTPLPWEYFHNALWNHPDPQGEQLVFQCVKHLRDVLHLGETEESWKIISVQTDRGAGYCFVPPSSFP